MSQVSVLHLLAFLAAGMGLAAPPHARFVFKDNVIQLRDRPDLRLNVKGGDIKAGDPLVLWPCSPHMHELFEPLKADGQIRLTGNKQMCLNAAGGIVAGTKIITWPCAQNGTPSDHEVFELERGKLRLKSHPEMCVNIKEGTLQMGAEVILWRCDQGNSENDLFEFKDGTIRLQAKPELRLNVAGGNLQDAEMNVTLWSCQPHTHEFFEFTNDERVRLKDQPNMCVNAESGLGPGHRLVIWPCSEQPAPNEMFNIDSTQHVIISSEKPNLAFNAKGGGINVGDEVVLWPLIEEEL